MFTLTISKTDAKNAMREFLRKHSGETVYFHALSEEEKPAYVLVDHYNYFRFLPPKERLERAISNVIAHHKRGYVCYGAMECMQIPEWRK